MVGAIEGGIDRCRCRARLRDQLLPGAELALGSQPVELGEALAATRIGLDYGHEPQFTWILPRVLAVHAPPAIAGADHHSLDRCGHPVEGRGMRTVGVGGVITTAAGEVLLVRTAKAGWELP